MEKTEQLKQIDGAWERVVEAFILMENVATQQADMRALDISGLLNKVNRQLGDYRATVSMKG
jgi:hypothetical protein